MAARFRINVFNKKDDHEHHQVRRNGPIGVGDTVHIPGTGPTTVNTVGKRYFTGTTSEGVKVGQTGIGLLSGQSMSGPPQPWKVERGGSARRNR